MMSPASNRSQHTGQIKSPSAFGLANVGSLTGSTGGSGCAGGSESCGCGTRNSLPQSGQSTFIPAASSSAFSFRPHDGHKKRNSITQVLCLLSGMISNYPPKSKPNSAFRMNYPESFAMFLARFMPDRSTPIESESHSPMKNTA